LIVFFVVFTAALGTALWLMFGPFVRRARRRRQARESFPSQWRSWLEQHVPLYVRLPEELRQRLRDIVAIFVHEKTFVGCDGLVVTDMMKVIIAGHAGILVLNRPGVPFARLYDELHSILVYPAPFVVPETRHEGSGLVSEGHRVLLGQAFQSSRIILSWENIEQPQPLGHNVVLHEFAHYLDMEDDTMDGAPELGAKDAYRQWSEVFWREFQRLRNDLGAGQPTLLDPYAATAPAEFFAVVTEFFFEQPQALEREHPTLYDQLRRYFRLDPARWALPLTPVLELH
jgi:Mlc titration factor MtfA (ptsG expression regulator)